MVKRSCLSGNEGRLLFIIGMSLLGLIFLFQRPTDNFRSLAQFTEPVIKRSPQEEKRILQGRSMLPVSEDKRYNRL